MHYVAFLSFRDGNAHVLFSREGNGSSFLFSLSLLSFLKREVKREGRNFRVTDIHSHTNIHMDGTHG